MDNNNFTLNMNMNNLEEDERKQLIALIEKANKPKSKIWKPSNSNRVYFCITTSGDINYHCWSGQQFDEDRYKLGNCYPTKEDAEFATEAYKVYVELKRYAEEHNDTEIDWTTVNTKVVLVYRHNTKMIHYLCVYTTQDIGQIYFSSEKIAKAAVEEIGENRIKKYLFRVE